MKIIEGFGGFCYNGADYSNGGLPRYYYKGRITLFFEEYLEMELYPLAKGDSLSPEAQECLEKRREGKRFAKPRGGGDWAAPESCIIEGLRVDVKPEGMTHLCENVLVYWDAPDGHAEPRGRLAPILLNRPGAEIRGVEIAAPILWRL